MNNLNTERLSLWSFRQILFWKMRARTLFLQPVTQSKQSRSRLHFDKMYPRRQEGDAVMSCLMEQLARGSPAMTKECGEVLMQIHYFLARWTTSSLSFCSKQYDLFFNCCVFWILVATVTIFCWKESPINQKLDHDSPQKEWEQEEMLLQSIFHKGWEWFLQSFYLIFTWYKGNDR